MHVDLSVNIAVLVAIVAGIIKLTVHLTRIEAKMDTTSTKLGEHTAADEKQFDAIWQQIQSKADRLAHLETQVAGLPGPKR